jgi:surfeit locus 1 family protein
MRRYLFPLILGLGGIAILMSLGLWQLRRLDWKEGVIAAIEARIGAEPVELDRIATPEPARDQYQPVRLAGTTGEDLLVLSGQKGIGAGYEVIAAFITDDGRRLLLDRGFLAEADRDRPRPAVRLAVTGNLLWPDDADSYTPPPDAGRRLWFARDIATMSEFLQTEPLLVVAGSAEGQEASIVPVPVNSSGIPNDHLEYALTWFSLAGVWAGMTAFLLWRIRRRTA